MRTALALGMRGLGRTWPNPSVGCLIVKDGQIVGRGRTQDGGRPHAETEALAAAGERARGATAYVTLEPCSNWGRTQPCSKALIDAGVQRVVAGCVDPDPRVNGSGLDQLRAAGIEVTEGILEDACRQAHIGLYRRILARRPAITLKLAQSLDGRIALADGTSKWLTGSLARRHAHRLRAQHDAIMIGSGTALADDPELSCRIDGLEHASPVRVVVDRRGRLPATSRLVRTAERIPLWIVRRQPSAELIGPGIEQLQPPSFDIETILDQLAERGLTRLLVEGGAKLAGALLRAGCVDRLELFTAPRLLGGDATASTDALGLQAIEERPHWRHVDRRELAADRLDVYARDG